ncbi:hypothetical protein DIPPA_19517 [Diplonema papillatum]|nr:hypothetical protein DIPPA_19517 [Diplonema papillatum]
MKTKTSVGGHTGKKFNVGDAVKGIAVHTNVFNIKGVVVGYKDDKVRVKFEEGRGKLRVSEDSIEKCGAVVQAVAAKPKVKPVRDARDANGTVSSTVPSRIVSRLEVPQRKPTREPVAAPVDTTFPDQLDGAALDLLFRREGMSVMNLKHQGGEGSWLVEAPSEVHGCQGGMPPWYRKAEKTGTDFHEAAKSNTASFAAAHQKVENFRKREGIHPSFKVSELLGELNGDMNSNVKDRIPPFYIHHRGGWRKCIVFKPDDDSVKFPVWLLRRGEQGWEPDVRMGVIQVDREDIHTSESRRAAEDLRKAEIGEVTRLALSWNDLFPHPTALERALLCFPKCFTQAAKRRFAVSQTIPIEPLPQFGQDPGWLDGAYSLRADQNAKFAADTPTGGPLVGAPSWPLEDSVCIECGGKIDASCPGGALGGIVQPSFVGRTDALHPEKTQFLHIKTCAFAHKERTELACLEILWPGSAIAEEGSLLRKSQTIRLSVDCRVADCTNGIQLEYGCAWHVGERGIIHVNMKETNFEFLHFPSRKLVFLISEAGKKFSDTASFEEGERPCGNIVQCLYAKPGSFGLYLAQKKAARKRAERERASAIATASAEVEVVEDAEIQCPPSSLLDGLSGEVLEILDNCAHLLEDRRFYDDTSSVSALSLSSDDGDSDKDDDKMSDDEKMASDEESTEVDSSSEEMEDAMMRPVAEDEGEVSEDEDVGDRQQRLQSYRKIQQAAALKNPENRTPLDLLPFIEGRQLLRLAENSQTDDLFTNVDISLTAVNKYLTVTSQKPLPGCEQSFPPIKPVKRDHEWLLLQQEWGAGLADEHFESRYLTPPYKKLTGPLRSACKYLSQMTETEHRELLLFECLLLSRSIARRSSGSVACTILPVADRCLSSELRKLYYDQSLWLRTLYPYDGDKETLRTKVAAQLMLPAHRVQAGAGGIVRICGKQETLRNAPNKAKEHSMSISSAQTQKLMQLYHVGRLLLHDVGVFRGKTGKWTGAVGPAVTQLNALLRGVYTPFTPTFNNVIDNYMTRGGLWVYQQDGTEKRPLEELLGKDLPSFANTVAGQLKAPRQRLTALIACDDEADSDMGTDDSDTIDVAFKFVNFAQYNQITIEFLSGVHQGESTTLHLEMQPPVNKVLWEADITSPALENAICSITDNGDGTSKLSELFWLLLPADSDRSDSEYSLYPWRFHSLLKRFGLTRGQAVQLRQVVMDIVEPLITKSSERTELEKWKRLVRLKVFTAWTKLKEEWPMEVTERPADHDESENIIFDDTTSNASCEALGEVDGESSCHGVDTHCTSAICGLVKDIMQNDPVGRASLLRAFHRIRTPDGSQRFHWKAGVFVDVMQEVSIPQSVSGRLALQLRKEVRKNGYTGEDADEDDATSSDWDEVSLQSSNDSRVDVDHSSDEQAWKSDPFSRQATDHPQLRGRFHGCCNRCEVTIQNLFRFADVVSDKMAAVPRVLLHMASANPELRPTAKEYTQLLDSVIEAAVVWGQQKQISKESAKTQETRFVYLNAVQKLWEARVSNGDDSDYDETTSESSVEASDSDISSRGDDRDVTAAEEDAANLYTITYGERHGCESGLCRVWDVVLTAYEQIVKADTVLQENTAFRYSIVAALASGKVHADTWSALCLASILQPSSTPALFGAADALNWFQNDDTGTVLTFIVQQNLVLADTAALVDQVDSCHNDVHFAGLLTKAAGCDNTAIKLYQLERPFHRILFNTSAGKVTATFRAESFEDALSIAMQAQTAHFCWNSAASRVDCVALPNELQISFVNEATCTFCTIAEERFFEVAKRSSEKTSRWMTYAQLAQEAKRETCDQLWLRGKEARRDPTDNNFYTEELFKKRHQSEKAWSEAEERRVTFDGNIVLQSEFTGSQGEWEGLFETRRVGTRGFDSYSTWEGFEHANPQTHEGAFLTFSECVRRFRKKKAIRLWNEAEPHREHPLQPGHIFSYTKFTEESSKSLDDSFALAPAIAYPEPVIHDATVYEMTATEAALKKMCYEGPASESLCDFAAYAGLKFDFIARLRTALNRVVALLPEVGDFTKNCSLVFTLNSSCPSLQQVKAIAGKALHPSAGKLSETFKIEPISCSQIDVDHAVKNIQEARQITDQSYSLQKLFKAREAAFPEEVFDVVKHLRMLAVSEACKFPAWSSKFVTAQMFSEIRTIFCGVGCRRLLTAVMARLGLKNFVHASEACGQNRVATAAFTETLIDEVCTQWAKPLQPAALPYSEQIAASNASWIPDKEVVRALQGNLRIDAAAGIVDWALRLMISSHLPLNHALRDCSQRVNVIKIIPLEVRHPRAHDAVKSNECTTRTLSWELSLYTDSRKFEVQTDNEDEDDSLFADMHVGYQVKPERIHKVKSLDTSSVSILSQQGSSTEVHDLRPLIFVTDLPVRVLSYRIQANNELQPITWRVEGALISNSQVQKLKVDKMFQSRQDEDEFDFTYLHRHTEHASRPIDELTFVPPTTWVTGQFVEGDMVESCESLGEKWRSGGIVSSVDIDGKPLIAWPQQDSSSPKVGHIRRASPQDSSWFGAVPHTPSEWSAHFEIPDQVPLVFAYEQSPKLERDPYQVQFWNEEMEFINTHADIGQICCIKLGSVTACASGEYYFTRQNEDDEHMVWEWGSFVKTGATLKLTPVGKGLPGPSAEAPLHGQEVTASINDFGTSLTIYNQILTRRNPKRLFCQVTEDDILEPVGIPAWQYSSAYDLRPETYNNHPVWCSTNELSWLFCDSTGKWAVSAKIGGRPIMLSNEPADVLPAMCSYNIPAENGGWTSSENRLFFVTATLRYEVRHLQSQLTRLGIDRSTLNALGYNADDPKEMRQELHNQLSERRFGECLIGDIWDGVRMEGALLRRTLTLWKNSDETTVNKVAQCQFIRSLTTRFMQKVGSVLDSDFDLRQHEREAKEDDAIAAVAAELVHNECGAAVAAQWAQWTRWKEGSLFSDDHSLVLKSFRERHGTTLLPQLEGSRFNSHAERSLRDREADLWNSDSLTAELFQLADGVLQQDFSYISHAENFERTQFSPSTPQRAVLMKVVSLMPPAKDVPCNNPWKEYATAQYAAPKQQLLVYLREYFQRQHTAHEILQLRRKCVALYKTSLRVMSVYQRLLTEFTKNRPTCPIQDSNLDEVVAETSLLAVHVWSQPHTSSWQHNLGLRWPVPFHLAVCSASFADLSEVPQSRWVQLMESRLVQLDSALCSSKNVLNTLQTREYARHRRLVKQAKGTHISGHRQSSWTRQKAVSRALTDYKVSKACQSAKSQQDRTQISMTAERERKSKYRQSEAAREKKKEYRQSEAAREKKKEYRQSEAAKMKQREYRQKWHEQVSAKRKREDGAVQESSLSKKAK